MRHVKEVQLCMLCAWLLWYIRVDAAGAVEPRHSLQQPALMSTNHLGTALTAAAMLGNGTHLQAQQRPPLGRGWLR
jgi:hypothetical protein